MSHRGKTRILLIDDDEIFCQLLEKNVSESNADKKKDDADSQIELSVLNRLKQLKNFKDFEKTDLILLDYDLYDGTGIEASEWLLKKAPNIPQVIISSSDREVEVDPDGGAVKGFVTKWQGQREFLAAVQKYTMHK